jgi:predicted permease
LAVVAILASAIAVAALLGALFAVVLHDVPPIESPDRIGRVWFADDTRPAGHREASFADFLTWKEAARTLTDLTAFTIEERMFGGSDGLRVRALSVTPEYFQLTRRAPMLGRAFAAGDGDGGGPIIVSDRLWRARFGSDPHIVGRRVRLDVEPREIVGVMPPDFWFPARGIDVWLPLAANGQALIDVAGRLRDGRAWTDAQAEFNVLARSRTLVRSLQAEANIRLGPGFEGFVLPALAILLIACANVGNLLVMRLAGRERELAIRTALGASAAHLARLSLAETTLLATAAAGAGFVLALLGTTLLEHVVAAIPQMAGAVKAGPLTIVATVAATAITLGGTAVFPALQAARSDVSAALTGSRRQRTSNRFHYHATDLLVVLQIALAVVLVLVGIFWLRIVREIVNTSVPPAGDRTLVARLTTRKDLQATIRADALERVVDEASGVPGVDAVALTTHLPELRGQRLSRIAVASPGGSSECRVKIAHVTPRFFDVIGVTFQSGAVRPGVSAVASVGAAKRCVAGDLAAPWSIRPADESTAKDEWRPITGVVSDPSSSKIDTADSESYVWILGARAWPADVFFLSAGPRGLDLRPRLSEAVGRASPEIVLDALGTWRERVDEALAGTSLIVGVMSTVALLALVLAFTGVYAAMSQSCESRRVELGIRVALGAPPLQLVTTALAREAPLVAAGMVTGIVGTLWVTAMVWREMLIITALDPRVWMVVFAVLLAAAVLAALGPALRAVRVDPIDVLRAD